MSPISNVGANLVFALPQFPINSKLDCQIILLFAKANSCR